MVKGLLCRFCIHAPNDFKCPIRGESQAEFNQYGSHKSLLTLLTEVFF